MVAATRDDILRGSPTCENELVFNSHCSLSILRLTLLAIIPIMTHYKLGSVSSHPLLVLLWTCTKVRGLPGKLLGILFASTGKPVESKHVGVSGRET